MDSAIGLSTMIAIGRDNFRAMLDGFHQMDEHFRTTSFDRNLPCSWDCCLFGTTTSSAQKPSRFFPTSNI